MVLRTYFRSMRAGPDGAPVCGDSATRLGVRERDVARALTSNGGVQPERGGMSVAPDDPMHLPEEFRPEALGGTGRLPVFSIEAGSSAPISSCVQTPKSRGGMRSSNP